MLKVLLIDDEERATDSLRMMIEKMIPVQTQVKTVNDPRMAASVIHDFQPALVFLDIQMPHMNGFQLLESLPNKHFKIVFTTAYNQYAIDAIRFSAFDYLLKPIDVEELQAAITRFVESKEDYKQQFDLLKNILHNFQMSSADDFRLALPTSEGVYYLQPADIVRCEAIGNYTRFFTSDNKKYMISRTLGDYDELLSAHSFIRTHRSHLVNGKYISFVDHDGFVILKDNTRVELSRRRKEQVLKMLK
jgi:two-component system LytT family response regulator